MKIILYMAISVNGFIARADDSTDWVTQTDWGELSSLVNKIGTVIMGKKTYEFSEDNFPYGVGLNIVMTHDKSLISNSPKVIFTDQSPQEVIKLVKNLGCQNILIIGGGKINSAFLKNNLINEIYLSVHPFVLDDGIKLFHDLNIEKKLKLLEVKQLPENLVQLHYSVV